VYIGISQGRIESRTVGVAYVFLGHTVALPKGEEGEEARKESRALHFTLYEDDRVVEMTAYAETFP